MSLIQQTGNVIRSTFINGIIFLIPLVALGWVFSGAIGGIGTAIGTLQNNLWIKSHGGLVLLLPVVLLAAIAFIFALGILVRIALLRRAKNWVEHQVLDMMPGYNFLKSMMEEKLHVKENNGIPVLVQWPSSEQLGILVDQKVLRCVVFFPNSTILGGGAVHIVDASQVVRLPFSLTEFDNILIRSGGGLLGQLTAEDGKND
ncbi:hypothetical protein ACFFGT_02520 [Mucilaginibacter angelicae]|uniref:DUF502 domain-containing protein n=1 Tax=Mucilaginibacter angelicae TaxID=869718 RepID=A0ABV6L016_9SPHI